MNPNGCIIEQYWVSAHNGQTYNLEREFVFEGERVLNYKHGIFGYNAQAWAEMSVFFSSALHSNTLLPTSTYVSTADSSSFITSLFKCLLRNLGILDIGQDSNFTDFSIENDILYYDFLDCL